MSKVVIQVDNLSKQYRLGMVGTGTLSHDISRWWHLARGKEDPFLKIGNTNKRDIKGDSDYVWALRDINFEVKQGEVLGIIGKNGAGKSTLLKILSRVTSPTTGEFKIKGRIASLLEVGTGFHPELTGRENIFLNGSILGMTKAEISSKFDEIVAFSGVERYIDTPVKRYSSGMYVRLAFAVAAHLEPEILIVDEVLAVGDAEFQKKCLGKMKDVAGQGRTILFVSHNMIAVKNLCNRAILLEEGTEKQLGNTNDVIDSYFNTQADVFTKNWGAKDAPGNEKVKLTSVQLNSSGLLANKQLNTESTIDLIFGFEHNIENPNINITLHFCTPDGTIIFATRSTILTNPAQNLLIRCTIPCNTLNNIDYRIDALFVNNSSPVFIFENCISFRIHETERQGSWFGKWPGTIRPILNWDVIN
jgi:lipopolysaccharide transport system ATP-binding protein